MKHLLACNGSRFSQCASSTVFCVGFLTSPWELPVRKVLPCPFASSEILCNPANIIVLSIKVCLTLSFNIFYLLHRVLLLIQEWVHTHFVPAICLALGNSSEKEKKRKENCSHGAYIPLQGKKGPERDCIVTNSPSFRAKLKDVGDEDDTERFWTMVTRVKSATF